MQFYMPRQKHHDRRAHARAEIGRTRGYIPEPFVFAKMQIDVQPVIQPTEFCERAAEVVALNKILLADMILFVDHHADPVIPA